MPKEESHKYDINRKDSFMWRSCRKHVPGKLVKYVAEYSAFDVIRGPKRLDDALMYKFNGMKCH